MFLVGISYSRKENCDNFHRRHRPQRMCWVGIFCNEGHPIFRLGSDLHDKQCMVLFWKRIRNQVFRKCCKRYVGQHFVPCRKCIDPMGMFRRLLKELNCCFENFRPGKLYSLWWLTQILFQRNNTCNPLERHARCQKFGHRLQCNVQLCNFYMRWTYPNELWVDICLQDKWNNRRCLWLFHL